MKILFVCKRRLDVEKGKTYGLETSAFFVVNYLKQAGIEVEIGRAADANDIDRVVTNYNPTHVILEALWVTPEKLKEILAIKRHRNRIWIIRIHSRVSFLANEGMAFAWLLGYREQVYPMFDNLWIAPNTEEVAVELKETFGLKTVYLPNIYCCPKYELAPKTPEPGVLNVGLFGAVRPMKNHLLQAVAAVRYANKQQLKLKLHMNSSRTEQKGDQCLKNIKAFMNGQKDHEFVPHEWMPHRDFVELCSHMDIGLQVSFSETFDIVAADFIYHGVPLIGSKTINWLPSVWQVDDPNISEEIVSKMDHALGFWGSPALWYAQHNLIKWNECAEKQWHQFFKD